MRTARAVVLFTSNERPTKAAQLADAQHALDRHADGATQASPVRFVGYDTTSTSIGGVSIPAGARVAVYEADYDDDPPAGATTLANVSPILRPAHILK